MHIRLVTPACGQVLPQHPSLQTKSKPSITCSAIHLSSTSGSPSHFLWKSDRAEARASTHPGVAPTRPPAAINKNTSAPCKCNNRGARQAADTANSEASARWAIARKANRPRAGHEEMSRAWLFPGESINPSTSVTQPRCRAGQRLCAQVDDLHVGQACAHLLGRARPARRSRPSCWWPRGSAAAATRSLRGPPGMPGSPAKWGKEDTGIMPGCAYAWMLEM